MISTISHILLVDDDEDDRIIFRHALSQISASTKLSITGNADQLLGLLNEGTDLPDAIFLDLNMARKSGFECLTELRKNLSYQNIPVFIYSTSSQESAINTTYLLGADYYVVKPCDFVDLKKALTKIFSLGTNLKRPQREDYVLMY